MSGVPIEGRPMMPRRLVRGSLAAVLSTVLAGSTLPTALAGPAARVALAAPTLAARETSLTAAEWDAVKRVIERQLEALRRGDAKGAYSFASPGIQQQFVDADTFMAMVRSGYAALLDARYTEFLEAAVIEGAPVQPLRLIRPDNSVVVALYRMERDGRGWRIAGCVIAPSTVKAA
jgi:hypothetical protein